MQKLTYNVAVSLDGFIARKDGSYDGFLAEGEHVAEYLRAIREDYGTVLMGRATYDVGLAVGVVDPYPWLETFVFTSRAAELAPGAPRVSFVDGDANAFVRALKAKEGKGIYLCGGGKLAASLLGAGLVDELVLKVNPVLFGRGIPVIDGAAWPSPLALTGSVAYPSGVVVSRYAVA